MPKKNAYTYFVEERCNATGKQLVEGYRLFGRDWERLEDTDRQKYFDMAEGKRRAPFRDEVQDNKSFGDSSAIYLADTTSDKPKLKMADIILEVNHGIAEVVVDEARPASGDFKSPTYEDIELEIVNSVAEAYPDITQSDVPLFIVNCIPLITLDNNLKEVNRPLEISVETCKVALGYTGKKFHSFIDPGPIPCGWSFWISSSRKKYHKIPHSRSGVMDDDAKLFHSFFQLNKDYYKLYSDLLRVTAKVGGGHYPLLSTANDVCSVHACLQWLYASATRQGRDSGKPDLPQLKISTLEEYVMSILLAKGIANIDELHMVKRTMELKRYHHEHYLRCEFHKQVDSELCASATARDKIYLLFDYLRGVLDLPDDGAHVPSFP